MLGRSLDYVPRGSKTSAGTFSFRSCIIIISNFIFVTKKRFVQDVLNEIGTEQLGYIYPFCPLHRKNSGEKKRIPFQGRRSCSSSKEPRHYNCIIALQHNFKHMFANSPPSSPVMGEGSPPSSRSCCERAVAKQCDLLIQWVGFDLQP